MDFFDLVVSPSLAYGIEKGWDGLGGLVKSIRNNRKFQDIFLEAGAAVAEYEKDDTEECESRKAIFCQENMLVLANEMKNISSFEWGKKLNFWLDDLLVKSVLSTEQKKRCKTHFMEVIAHEIMHCFPEIYQQNLMNEMVSQVKVIGQDVKWIRNLAEEQGLEETNRKVQEYSSRPGRYLLPNENKIIRKKVTWKLSYYLSRGELESLEERKGEILYITDLWKRERESYPDWYIPPYHICYELSSNSVVYGLLQVDKNISTEDLLELTYELVWRYETGMKLYESYEQKQIRVIWNDYQLGIDDLIYQMERSTDEQAESIKKHIRHWFYIGQALLRGYREEGKLEEWQELFKALETYKEYGLNGTAELQMEKIKFYFMNLELKKVRRLLDKWDIPNEQYEIRLQVAGIWAELGEVEIALQMLKKLGKSIDQKISETGNEKSNEKERFYLYSLKTGMLRLVSLVLQGYTVWKGKREEYQETINYILEMTDENREYFDWQLMIEQIRTEMLKWHVQKYKQDEVFEINRESVTVMSSRNICEDAYRLYRVLDKLALPLQSNHVMLISDTEFPWIEALMEINGYLATNIMIRGANSKNVKGLINRRFLARCNQNIINNTIIFLKDALDKNLEEIAECNVWRDGNIYTCILEHVPTMLTRYLTRCSEYLQPDMMMLLKRMNDIPGFDLNRHMDEFTNDLMCCMSERTKLNMLGTMLECGIHERNEDRGSVAAFDIFDFYIHRDARREMADLKQAVSKNQIEKLLEKATHSEYEWRMIIPRLQTLYDLKILEEKYQRDFGELLWSRILKDTNMPDFPKKYLWVFTTLPHPKYVEPRTNIKNYFLTMNFSTVSEVKEKRASFYLEELEQAIRGVGKELWSLSETEKILEKLKKYWDQLKKEYQQKGQIIGGLGNGSFLKTVPNICATICSNLSGGYTEKICTLMRGMICEMKDIGFDSLCLEILFSSETECTDVINRITDNMYSMERRATVDAMNAAYICIKKSTDSKLSEQLLFELANVVKARKEPGVTSALITFHNILYENIFAFSKELKMILEKALIIIEEETKYQNQVVSEKEMKERICIRRACAYLARQLSLHCDGEEMSEGVRLWRDVCEGDEFIEVKKAWGW